MISNFPATGTATIFSNPVVEAGMSHFTGSQIIRELTLQEAPQTNTEEAFQLGSIVNLRVKPFRQGQVLTNINNNFTSSQMAYGNIAVELDYVFGDSILITPQDVVAAENGNIDPISTAIESLLQGTVNRYEATQVNNIRTLTGVQANLGTSGNALTYATIQAVRTNNPELPAQHEIIILCDAGTFGEISRLPEVVNMESRTSASEYKVGEIFLPALNIRIIQSAYYTPKAIAADPKFTAFARGTILAPLRTPGIVGAEKQRVVTTGNIRVLLSMTESRQGGTLAKTIDAAVYSGFQKFTPQMTSGSTSLGKYFIQHCVGGL